jgi:hypothetical protein
MKKYNLIHFSYNDYKITEETKNEEVIVKEYKYRKCAENWINKQEEHEKNN